MKFRVFLLLTLVLAAVLVPVQAQEDEVVPFEDGQISFAYDPTLGTDVMTTLVEPMPYDATVGMPLWASSPYYVEYSLVDYPNADQFYYPNSLKVYSTNAFLDYDDPENGYGYQVELTSLQTLLEEQPDLADFTAWNTNGEMNLPYLPLANAAQVFRLQPEYIEFQNGKGIRYLSYYSQAVNPITEADIFYTFQGVTNDGTTYISAVFPVQTGIFPTEIPTDGFDYDAFSANYNTYMEESSAALSAQAEDAFTPWLSLLDDLVDTIDVVVLE